jgi:hypothetical protein
MAGKIKILFSVIALLLVMSCDEKPQNPVKNYGDVLIDTYKRGGETGEKANLDALRKAVMTYQTTHDKYPESLDELRELIVTPIDLSRYEYNPDSGSVSLKK